MGALRCDHADGHHRPPLGRPVGGNGSGRARPPEESRRRRQPHPGRTHRRGSDRQGRRPGRRSAPSPRGPRHRTRRAGTQTARRRARQRLQRLRVVEPGGLRLRASRPGCHPPQVAVRTMPTSSRPRCCPRRRSGRGRRFWSTRPLPRWTRTRSTTSRPGASAAGTAPCSSSAVWWSPPIAAAALAMTGGA